jgi:hypothetical protein
MMLRIETPCAASSGAGTQWKDDGDLSSAPISSAGDRHDQSVLLKGVREAMNSVSVLMIRTVDPKAADPKSHKQD